MSHDQQGASLAPARPAVARGTVAGFPIYPILLALAFILAFPAGTQVRPETLGRALVVILAVAAIVVCLALLIYRDPDRAGLAASLVLFLAAAATDPRVALAIAVLLVLIWIESRLRPGHSVPPWPLVTRLGLVFSGALVVILLVQATGNWMSRQSIHVESAWDSAAVAPAGGRPNIYLILADGLGRADVMADYGVDSGQFIDQLATNDFDLSRASRANYMMTQLSLASMLNGGYLDDLGIAEGAPVPPAWLQRAIEDPAAFRLLRRAGYETAVVPSGYEGARIERADVILDSSQLSEAEGVMLEGTGVDQAVNGLWPTLVADSVRGRTMDTFAALSRMARDGGSRKDGPPLFAFIHLPIPHFPFIFGRHCEPIDGGVPNTAGDPVTGSSKTPAEREREISLTAGQSVCTQRLLAEAVADVIAHDPDAVVVLFSDHGPDARLDWWRPANEGMRERLSNFVAVRTPGHPGLLPDDVTLVNVLPRLFNAYLGTGLPILEDRTYFGLDRVMDTVRLVDSDP